MSSTISDRARTVLSAWHSRRPSFAVMGEYSSGKSALLNGLLGGPVLPTRVTATDLPAVWITRGRDGVVQGLGYDGHLVDLSPDALSDGQAMQFLCLRIETGAALVDRIDIIDTPGISDPRMTTEIVEEIARHVDFVVWCSTMTQAWRQTERAFWGALPAVLKPHSLLALTRADLMANASDHGKVLRRCRLETMASFAAVIPVASVLAQAALAEPSGPERARLLRGSGMPELTEALERSITHAQTLCAARSAVDMPPALGVLALTESIPDKPLAKPKPKAETRARNSGGDRKAFSQKLRAAAQNFPPNQHGLDTFRHHLNELSKEHQLDEAHLDVLLLSLADHDASASGHDRLMQQVRDEIEDFADGPWCDLSA